MGSGSVGRLVGYAVGRSVGGTVGRSVGASVGVAVGQAGWLHNSISSGRSADGQCCSRLVSGEEQYTGLRRIPAPQLTLHCGTNRDGDGQGILTNSTWTGDVTSYIASYFSVSGVSACNQTVPSPDCHLIFPPLDGTKWDA